MKKENSIWQILSAICSKLSDFEQRIEKLEFEVCSSLESLAEKNRELASFDYWDEQEGEIVSREDWLEKQDYS